MHGTFFFPSFFLKFNQIGFAWIENEARRNLSKFISMIYKIKSLYYRWFILYLYRMCINLFILYYRVAGIYDVRLIPLYHFANSNSNYISLHDWIQCLQWRIYIHTFYVRIEEIYGIPLQRKKIEIDVVSFACYLQPCSFDRKYADRRHLRDARLNSRRAG